MSKDIMAHTASELRIQKLRIRIWLRVAFCVLYVSAAIFCVFIHTLDSLVGAILLVAFAVINVIIIRRSIEELSRLRDNEPSPAYGPSQPNMTLAQLQSRAHKLRLRTWSSIVAAAIFTSGALFFVLRQNVIAALPLIGLTAISALIINRSAEELLRLGEGEPEAR
jgi:4-hydroxybenzoate polyprenyltransferase